MAVERESINLWSTTAGSNGSIDTGVNFAEGQLPGTVNNSARGMMAALARWKKDNDGSLTTAGSANAYTLTINQTYTAYANGQRLSFKASFSNTGAATLNVTNADTTAIGAKAIRAAGDIALTSGQIVSGGRYDVEYDTSANSAAGAWVLLGSGDVRAANNGTEFTAATFATNLALVRVVKKQIFTASGTYTPSTGMLYCIIECVGAGGGGGGAGAGNGSTTMGIGGAGGGGGYARTWATAATIGASKSVTVGAPGTGATAGANGGGAGGASNVGTTICAANGGNGGAAGSPGTVTNIAGAVAGAGTSGDLLLTGSAGQAGFFAGSGIGIAIGGLGGMSAGGFGGGAAGGGFNSNGAAGGNYGGGGAGGVGTYLSAVNNSGGAGGPGIVVITEFCTQ